MKKYSKSDVMDIAGWFTACVPEMLRELADEHIGAPQYDMNGEPMAREEWEATLRRMAFLLEETSDKTCSIHNPYHEICRRQYERTKAEIFRVNGWKTEQDILNVRDYSKVIIPNDIYYDILSMKCARWSTLIFTYQDRCKEEFFRLFSAYFWEFDLGI